MGPLKSTSSSSSDPACDQCRLKKIKCGRENPKCLACRRAGVPCIFSERGKRFSQSNIIIQSLEEVKSRLYHIEQTVSQFKTASKTTPPGTPAQDQLVPETFGSVDHETDEMSIDSSADRLLQGSIDLTKEQHQRSSSLALLLRDVYLALESNMDSESPSRSDDGPGKNTQECMAIMENLSKSLLSDDSLDIFSESLPPKLPPRGLLDACLEPYFRQVNPTLPVFDEDSFYDNIHKSYEAGSNQANRAWIVCFNNVILQTLNVKTASGFAKKPQDKANNPPSVDMETKISEPFQINLRRAISRLDYFLQPSLVSVQALMSMCLITQDNFQYRLASLLLQQACFVAKSIGLHQQNAFSTDHGPVEKLQRVRVFWTLYIIDKSITSMIGQPCYMPWFDCNVSLPENADLVDPHLRRLLPRIELALIQEDAYKRLYSSQPDGVGTERRSSIFHLSKKLTDGAFNYCNLFKEKNETRSPTDASTPPSTAVLSPQANTALTYHFHITRLMVHRSSKDRRDKKQCREDAVACVRLLQQLSEDSNSETGSILLRQTIRDCPLVPFFVLFHHAVQSPQSDASAHDLHLMVLATDIFQRVPGFTRLHAYTTYLSSCCRAVSTLIHKPTCVNHISPAEPLQPAPYSTDDPFAIFTDFNFDDDNSNSRRSNASDNSNKKSAVDNGENDSGENFDNNNLDDTLARGQHRPASFPSPTPDFFPTSSWTRNVDFANLTNPSNLTSSIWQSDNELRPSASPVRVQQHQQNLPQPQRQQDNQGDWPPPQQPQQIQQQLWQSGRQQQQQWPREMGMGFVMAEDGVSRWGENWLR